VESLNIKVVLHWLLMLVGLGLETYQRLVSVSSRKKLSTSRSWEADISVSAIYVSCPRPIYGQIVQATVRSVNAL